MPAAAAHMIGDQLHLFGGYNNMAPGASDMYTLDCSDPSGMESKEEATGDDTKKKKKKGDDDEKEED